jgi:cytochrome c biogenesis protein CcmG/thiol:disulfide interchange protein DsbE
VNRFAFLIPAVLLAGIAALFYAGLEQPPPGERTSSPLIGRRAPEFVLAALDAKARGFGSADFVGHPTIVNFWASWCAPCRVEHPVLQALRAQRGVLLFAVVYKDDAAKARAFLDELGDPFDRIGVDPRGRVAIDWGITGVPETFVVDAHGIVRAHISGPLTPEILQTVIRPALGRPQV